MDHRLIELLVCPVCKGPLVAGAREPGQALKELICKADRLAYPLHDGIPVMLPEQARALAVEEEVK